MYENYKHSIGKSYVILYIGYIPIVGNVYLLALGIVKR